MEHEEAVKALNALAHETRLAVFRLLTGRGADGLPAGAIANKLHVLPASLTFHLQELTRAGLIARLPSSRHMLYSADPATIDALIGYLGENCRGAAPRRARGRRADEEG